MAKKTTKKPAVRTKSRKAAAPKSNKQTLAQLLAMPTARSFRTPPAPQMVKAHTRNGNRPTHGGRPAPQPQTDSYKMPSEQDAFASLFGGAPVTHFVVEGPGELLELMQLLETDAAQNCPCGNCAARRNKEAQQRETEEKGRRLLAAFGINPHRMDRLHDFGFRSGTGPYQQPPQQPKPPMNPLNALIMKVATLADAQHGMGGQLVAETARAIGVGV